MNKVILIGNVGSIKKYDKVLSISVATNEKFKKDGEWEQKTTWHSVAVFGKFMDSYYKSISKGDFVSVEGSLTYTKKDDKTYTNINASSIRVLVKDGKVEAKEDKKSEEEVEEETLPF